MNEEIKKQRKEMILAFLSDKSYKPMRRKDMAGFFQVPRSEKEEFQALLDELCSEGRVTMNAKGCYLLPGADILTGTFLGTSKGFGFVELGEGEEDIFIPPEETKGAFHGDRVQVVITGNDDGGRREGRERREGRVTAILERGMKEIVGVFDPGKGAAKGGRGFGYVIPDNQRFSCDVYIPKDKTMGAVRGHKVVARLTGYGSETKSPEGEIVRILGHINDPGVDILSTIAAYDLPEEFPQEVLAAAAKAPGEVSEEEWKGRMDLRAWQTVTIDGEDAKDLDDAITITEDNGIYTLGVHIADVTHYVKEGEPLDREALSRGTSVYLVDRVIPMLPHRLSNGICSLNEGCDRLALSCIMEVDGKGTVLSHRIEETVINVDRRMSYTSVKKILEDHDEEESGKYEELLPMFGRMAELSQILRAKRRQRGSLDFDFPESKIILDQNGRPTDIRPYERNTATRLIEDFMLLANETVAEDFFWQEIPFVYRTHDVPDSEKIQQLGIFIHNFGYSIKPGKGEIHPKEIQKLLDKIEGSDEEAMISRVTLRSMKRARYTVDCTGHFGLSAKYYCHFTSPIRRYPDLQIHRIIKENLHGGLTEERREHYSEILPEVSAHSSKMERRADEAEREVEKTKKAEYMERFIGRCFDGVISGVASWGFYVELPNTVEGMVHVSELDDDYYVCHADQFCLTGTDRGRTYKLGQKIRVQVLDVDKALRTIDFIPAEL
ncbi:MAG: ribonuclease R [Lachnospiraceae bacterium]|nr:ribonuclease R [Lachnospiraceae bacterium]